MKKNLLIICTLLCSLSAYAQGPDLGGEVSESAKVGLQCLAQCIADYGLDTSDCLEITGPSVDEIITECLETADYDVIACVNGCGVVHEYHFGPDETQTCPACILREIKIMILNSKY